MIGILIVAHAPLGNAYLSVVHHVFRCMPADLEAIDVLPDQHTEETTQLIQQAITRVDSGNGVLVLTDISGATPANCCQRLNVAGQVQQVRLLAGLNLPMLMRALTYRDKSLDIVLEMARAGAQNGII